MKKVRMPVEIELWVTVEVHEEDWEVIKTIMGGALPEGEIDICTVEEAESNMAKLTPDDIKRGRIADAILDRVFKKMEEEVKTFRSHLPSTMKFGQWHAALLSKELNHEQEGDETV